MLVRDSEWQKVREHFTEDEKDFLRKFVTGEVICPRGFTTDLVGAGEVGAKLKHLVEELRSPGPARTNAGKHVTR
jgi:hypothetical protein